MSRLIRVGWALTLGAAGCATAPPLDNPTLVRRAEDCENPTIISPGVPTANSYRQVYERSLAVLTQYFDVPPGNPYAGVIVTRPRIAPGYEQFFKSGNPDPRERLLSTIQTHRQTATVEIRAAERGGFLVSVIVEKELEDLAQPSRSLQGSAAFTANPTVERSFEVVGPESSVNRYWIKIGRDFAFEQEILRQIRDGK
jgi:hypothetical protein